MHPRSIASVMRVQTNIQEDRTRQVIFEIRTDATLGQLELREGREMAFVTEGDLLNRDFAFNIRDVLLSYLSSTRESHYQSR